MYAKGKGSTVPSDAQAREKLALYVYEYLLHVGATKAAQTFLSEIRWEKNITLGEPPGFLHSWWCVFWDLYCAAPERRDTCEHSSEAKAFHDYGFVNSGYGVNGIGHNAGPAPPNDGTYPEPPLFAASTPFVYLSNESTRTRCFLSRNVNKTGVLCLRIVNYGCFSVLIGFFAVNFVFTHWFR